MQDSGAVKSNIRNVRLYWYVWSILLTLLLAVRFLLFRDSSYSIHLTLLIINICGTWFPMMILNHFELKPLESYLKQNHRSQWEGWFDAKSTFSFGEEFSNFNIIGWYSFVFSRDDLGDRVVGELKRNYRRFTIFVLTVILIFFVTAFLFMR
jgi:hypothetical protein